MRWTQWLCWSLVALAGCRVDQAHEVSTYRRVIDSPQLAPGTQPAASVTLPEVLRLANHSSDDLAVEGEAYYRVLNERRRAIANFLPTVDFAPTYARRDRAGSGTSGTNSARNVLDAPVDLTVNLFNGFGDVNRSWAADYRAEAAKHRLLDAQQTLLLDVARLHYGVLISESSLGVIEQSIVAQEERLRDTKGRFNAGLARPLDVSQTEAQVAETRVQWIDARRDIDTGRTTLSYVAASPLDAAVLDDGLTVPDAPNPFSYYLVAAVTARNDLRAAEAAVAAARRDVEVAVSQYYPSVSLDFSAFLYRETVPDDRRWEALLRLNVPIFAAGRIRADVLEAWSLFREAQIVRNRTDRQVRSDIQSALIEMKASGSRLAELRRQLEAAEAAYALAEQSYKAGIATNLDRLVAQSTLLTARLAFSREYFDRKLRYLNLLRVSGLLRRELETWR